MQVKRFEDLLKHPLTVAYRKPARVYILGVGSFHKKAHQRVHVIWPAEEEDYVVVTWENDRGEKLAEWFLDVPECYSPREMRVTVHDVPHYGVVIGLCTKYEVEV